MKKITILALHLGYGGIEKAICSLSNILCESYQIEIISTYKLQSKPAFYLDKKVSVEYLLDDIPNKQEWIMNFKKGKFFAFLKESIISIKILYLRKKKMIEALRCIDSDIIISTRPLHNKLLGRYGKKDSVKIAWEHSHHNNDSKYINELLNSCENIDYLIPVSKGLADFYAKKLKPGTKCIYIPLALDKIPAQKALLKNKKIISIGRLSKEKGFVDLIEVFKLVNNKEPDWHLDIVGDGPEKENIIAKIKEKGLEKTVTMHGFLNKEKINEMLLNSSLYVMTSFYESFGLVLIEAMSYGVPCVAFDSAKGALEIIDNSNSGYLIKERNKHAMTNKIISLIEDKEKRKQMGIIARGKSLMFDPDKIKDEWINLLEKK